MQRIYGWEKDTARKLKTLYQQSGIDTRYSVVPDYSLPAAEWKFYPPTENLEPFPSLEKRMRWYGEHAAALSLKAIGRCLGERWAVRDITHLITVSCTGMSAPGLDLELVDALGLPPNIFRTSINFMGCYAAVHALKLADALAATPGARVLIVCTELCTLHFQQAPSLDNLLSSLLFSDGAAAALVVADDVAEVADAAGAKAAGADAAGSFGRGLRLKGFYSEIVPEGKSAMTWGLSSTGFQMTLTGYVTDLIRADFATLVGHALERCGISRQHIGAWCIHPGGKRILDAINTSVSLSNGELDASYAILRQYGNMSSPTILFVLQQLMEKLEQRPPNCIFGAAFGPGLTMETFVAEPV